MSFQSGDLIILVADSYMEAIISSVISNNAKIGIRRIDYKVYRHPQHDPGCLLRAHHFLRPFARNFRFCLVLFDYEGCGQKSIDYVEIENSVKADLDKNGWSDRSDVIMIVPELEVWLWSDSPHVDFHLGWQGRLPVLRDWLKEQGLLEERDSKPKQPKEALMTAIRESRKSLSSSIYKKIAQDVSYERCSDRSFIKLKRILRNWFPENP